MSTRSAPGRTSRNSSGPYLALEPVRHAEQDLVRGIMAVRVVEQPEVVDVHQREAEPAALGPCSLDRLGHERNHRAVIQEVGEGIAAFGLHQVRLLTQDSLLGGPEHAEQHHPEQDGRGQGDDDDVAPRSVDTGKEWRRVAPNGHHRQRLALVGQEWEVFLHHLVGAEHRRPRVGSRGGVQQGDGRFAGDRGLKRCRGAGTGSPELGVGADQDRPVQAAQVNAQDLVFCGEGGEPRLERFGGGPAGAVLVDVGRRDVAVHEQLHERPVARHHRVQGRAGQVHGGDHHQRGGREPDEHQENAEDEREEGRPTRSDRPGAGLAR
jgi:hypothetical protein